MTVPFPPLRPSDRSFTKGQYPVRRQLSPAGTGISRRFGTRPIDTVMSLEFANITDADAAAIARAYDDAAGSYHTLLLPLELWTDLGESLRNQLSPGDSPLVTTPTSLTTNGNLDTWFGSTLGPLSVSGGFEFWSSPLADRWLAGTYIEPSNSPTGTFTIEKKISGPTELSSFTANNYLRFNTSHTIGTISLNDLTTYALSFISQQIENANTVLGSTVTLSFKARASQNNTKIVSESQIHSSNSSFWTPTICKTFNLSTSWQTYTHIYTMPTYAQVIGAAYNPTAVNPTLANPTYTPIGVGALPPRSSWMFQVDIKTMWSLGEWRRHGNAYLGPRPPGFENTQQTESEMNAMNNSYISNGYYDIADIQLMPSSAYSSPLWRFSQSPVFSKGSRPGYKTVTVELIGDPTY